MANFTDLIKDILVPLVANIGLLSILAWMIFFYGPKIFLRPLIDSTKTPILLGFVFGTVSAILMFLPIELAPGVITDSRGVPVIFAGIIGGPISAVITTIIGTLVRYLIGGPGWLAGSGLIIAHGLVGLIAHHFSKSSQVSPSMKSVVLIACFATTATLPAILLLPQEFQYGVLTQLIPQLLAANIIGSLILGQLLSRVERRYQVEQALNEAKTDIERANKKLSDSETRYRKLFDYAPIPLWEEDFTDVYLYFEKLRHQGVSDIREHFNRHPVEVQKCREMIKVLEVNYAAVNLHHAQSKNELLKNLNVIFSARSFEAFKEELIALANGQLKFEIEAELKTLSGEPIFIYLILFIEKLQDGPAMALLATVDITEQKNDEIEKRRLELELHQAQKLDSIGTLAGGIAHDFNNILSATLGYTELALEAAEKGTQLQEDIQDIYTASLRAKELVSQILAFARQTDEKRVPIQIDLIIKEVLKFIRSSIPTTIEIQQNIESDSLIIGNSTQIQRIIMNLCTNAAHAMENEGGELRITLKDTTINNGNPLGASHLPLGDYVEIRIADSGHGIEPQIIDKIYEPYFTTKKPGEGTGMGLAMVYGIVETYSGKINVKSVVGKGTTFTIYLPVAKEGKVHRENKTEELPTGHERILFVDDEPHITTVVDRILSQLGYSVTTKTRSTEALELFKLKPDSFDLVISDVTMPKMAGDQLAQHLMEIRPNIPIILCTGYSKRLSKDDALKIGIKALAHKPLVKEDLAKTVREVLDFSVEQECHTE